MDLESLRVFVRVAELGSVTRAAEQLGVSKATVSVRLQALETALDCRLLHRSTRRVRLSQEGEALLPRATALLQEADEIGAMFHSSRMLRGRVRIDLPVHIACAQVVPRLTELLSRYPKLEIQVSATDRHVQPSAEGIDCVLRVGTLGDLEAVCKRLGELPMVNCASPSYLRKYGTPQGIADLERHYVVHYAPTLGAEKSSFEYVEQGQVREVTVRHLVTVSNTEAYTAACMAGLGLIQVPRTSAIELIQAGVLQEVLPAWTCAPMPVWLLHTHGRRVPARIRVVLNWLEDIMSPYLQRAAVE